MDNNIKRETLRHKIIGYNDNISTMVKRRNIHLYSLRVAMLYVLLLYVSNQQKKMT